MAKFDNAFGCNTSEDNTVFSESYICPICGSSDIDASIIGNDRIFKCNHCSTKIKNHL